MNPDYWRHFYEFLSRYLNIRPHVDKDEDIQMEKVRSSNLNRVGYSPDKKLLEIEFKNSGRYRYPHISQSTYNDLINAPSLGKYFNKNIKPTSMYEKISLFK